MQREAVEIQTPLAILPCLHYGFGPFIEPRLAAPRPDGDLEHLLFFLLRRVEVADEAAIDLELACVVIGRHVAAAVPTLIADAEEGDLEGSRVAVGGALPGKRGRLRRGQVLQPLGCFLRRAGAEVDRQISLGSDLIKEIHELVSPERVRLDDAAPVGIERLWPLAPDAFAPVVLVGEAATRPAHIRHLDRLQRGDDIVADAASIRNRGTRPDPYAFVNAVAKMLSELAEDIAINLRSSFGCINVQVNLLSGGEGCR